MRNLSRFATLLILMALFNGLWSCTEKASKNNRRTTNSSSLQKRQQTSPKAASIRICSWNIRDLGKSKDAQEIAFMAELLRDFDLVAIQEVVGSFYGNRAVAKLADELNRKGSKWEYVVSERTEGDGPEKYAFLWKPSKVKIEGKPFLLKQLGEEFDREPFIAKFIAQQKDFVVVNLHLVPKSKDPEKEAELLDRIHLLFEQENMLILGDFNLDEKSEAFDGLKDVGFTPAFVGQKTSYKRKVTESGEHLHEEYDNIFFEGDIFEISEKGIVDFYLQIKDLKAARYISDHVPVWAAFQFQ